MRRRIFACVLALIMALTIMPTSALAWKFYGVSVPIYITDGSPQGGAISSVTIYTTSDSDGGLRINSNGEIVATKEKNGEWRSDNSILFSVHECTATEINAGNWFTTNASLNGAGYIVRVGYSNPSGLVAVFGRYTTGSVDRDGTAYPAKCYSSGSFQFEAYAVPKVEAGDVTGLTRELWSTTANARSASQAKCESTEYESVGAALDVVNSGTITIIEGITELTPVNGGTLNSGVTLETDEGTVTAADGSATINMDENGLVTLKTGKLNVSGDVEATLGGTNRSFSGGTDSQKYTVNASDDTLTVPANTTVTDGSGAQYFGAGTFTFNGGTVTPGSGVKIGSKQSGGDGSTVTGVAEGGTVVTIVDGNVKLTGGKGSSNGKMKATISGVDDIMFNVNGSKTYTVDTSGKTLTLGDGDGSVTGNGATFTGSSGKSFKFDKTDDKTTVEVPEGAAVSGITGVTPTGDGQSVTKVEIGVDDNTPTLIAGKGRVEGEATVKARFTVTVTTEEGQTTDVKTVEVTVPDGNAVTIDLDNMPQQVEELGENGSVNVDGITYTAVDNESTFPLDGNKLTRPGDKATVHAKTAKDVKLGDDDTSKEPPYYAPVVKVPNTNSGKTIITKTDNGGTVTIETEGDTFGIGDKTYTAGSGGAVFTVDKDGNVGISKGSVKLGDGDSIIGGDSGKTITNPAGSDNDTIVVTAEDGKATAKVPTAGGKVQIGGDSETEYTTGEDNTEIEVTKGGNKLTKDAVKLDSGETVDVGNSSTSVKNTGGEGTTITVKANDPSTGKSTVTAPIGGKVTIGGTEYDALATDTKFTVDDGGKTELTNGSATLNPGEGIVVKGVDTENTGSGDVTVNADGAVIVPANGGVTIGKAKITGVTKRTTFLIGGDDDGNKKVSVTLPAGGSVTVGGVTYTAASNGSGTLTIDPTTGKVIWASNVKAEIYDSSLIEYDMIPGVPVTVDGKYIYTAPLGGSLGDVKLTGRRDSEGKALNPAVNLKNNGGTVTVALANKPATSTVYTAANAGTRFAMSADDTDTTKIDLLDNGTSPNSALKFSDNEAHTVNGVVYQGQQVDGSVSKSAYTVTFGEASVDSGRRDEQGNVIMETVSRNIVSVESGSKVVVSMNVRATISVNSGRVKDNRFENVMPFTAAGKGASILIDNTDSGNPNVITARGYTYLEGITDSNGVITSYEIRRRYSEGGGVPTPTPTPAVVPVSIVLPKTGDMTIWQSILSFFGLL